jgi:hypothetical protein
VRMTPDGPGEHRPCGARVGQYTWGDGGNATRHRRPPGPHRVPVGLAASGCPPGGRGLCPSGGRLAACHPDRVPTRWAGEPLPHTPWAPGVPAERARQAQPARLD